MLRRVKVIRSLSIAICSSLWFSWYCLAYWVTIFSILFCFFPLLPCLVNGQLRSWRHTLIFLRNRSPSTLCWSYSILSSGLLLLIGRLSFPFYLFSSLSLREPFSGQNCAVSSPFHFFRLFPRQMLPRQLQLLRWKLDGRSIWRRKHVLFESCTLFLALRCSLYHYVNSPVGIFIQNSLIIFWTFMYPSVLTVVLLILSTLNMVLVKTSQIENEVLVTPLPWTQTLLIMSWYSFLAMRRYVQIIGLFYFAFSSGLATLLESYTTIYYLFFGGLTNFKGVNWFIWIFIFYMGWCTIVRLWTGLESRWVVICRRTKCAIPLTWNGDLLRLLIVSCVWLC